MTTLLDKTVDSELTGLRNHLEDFLQNLTTEAETMTSQIERSPAMPASYIQSPGSEWYQSQNGYDVGKTINQSNRTMQRATNGIDYSVQSQSLLCSVQNSPVWYTDWNTQMQMQYIQANRDQHSGEYSTYDALQGIQNVYSNYLQDTAEVSPSATQSSSKMRSTNIQDNCNNAIQSYKCANTSITCTSDNGIKPRSGSPAINSQTESDINEDSKIGVVRVQQQMDSRENDCGSGQIWRPW